MACATYLEETMIKLENLTVDEVQLILAGLSELPTKSGAWPVAMKIKEQADAQLAAEETKVAA